MNDLDDPEANLRSMYRQIIDSDKTSEEAKFEANYYLWHMDRAHLITNVEDIDWST